MITVFNRKQLIITYDITVQSKIRDILAAKNVDYTINLVMGLYGFSLIFFFVIFCISFGSFFKFFKTNPPFLF